MVVSAVPVLDEIVIGDVFFRSRYIESSTMRMATHAIGRYMTDEGALQISLGTGQELGTMLYYAANPDAAKERIQTGMKNGTLDDGELFMLAEYMAAYANKALDESRTFKRQAIMDELTQLPNRRAYDQALERYQRKISEQEDATDISYLMIDIDNFKGVNDTKGHSAGDYILQQVSDIIRTIVKRQTDVGPFRYGGEELCAILPKTSKESAIMLAELIREKVEETAMMFENQHIPLTVSIGVANYKSDGCENVADLHKKADLRVYTAKERGRNRVISE